MNSADLIATFSGAGNSADLVASLAGAGLATLLASSALSLALYVWVSLALGAVFAKAGIARWRAWVPVLNLWTFFTLGGLAGWWSLVIIVAASLPAIVMSVFVTLTVSANDTGLAVTGGLIAGALGIAAGVLAILLYIRALSNINRGFGLGVGLTVLGVLVFPVWASLVGWGSARWLGHSTDASLFHTAPPPPPQPSAEFSDFPAFTDFPMESALPLAPAAPVAPVTAAAPAFTPAASAPPPPASAPTLGNPWAPTPGFAGAQAPAFVPAPAQAPVAAPTPEPTPAPVPAPVAASSAPAAMPVILDGHQSVQVGIDDESTVLAARRVAGPHVRLPDGSTVMISAASAVFGRNPAAPHGEATAQLVAVADATRTVSKTHAILRQRGATWTITDLGSTNGVIVVDANGVELEAHGETPLTPSFYLGDALFTWIAEA